MTAVEAVVQKAYGYTAQLRREAKIRGDKQFFTGIPCKHGHVANRCTSSGGCVKCANESEKRSRKKALEQNKDLYKKRYQDNKDKCKERVARYRERYPERIKEAQRKSNLKRKPQKAAAEMMRIAMKLQATPKWLTVDQIEQIKLIYITCQKTSKYAGYKCHVDHIVPLKGKHVCGLHVPWNLRVVSQSYNSKKHNSMEDVPYMYDVKSVVIHSSSLPWNWRS